MNKFVIFSDSTCDLTTEQRREHKIEYVRMLVNWTDKAKVMHEIHADLDWEEISFHDYVNLLREGYLIMTSQITESEFDEKFIPVLEAGQDILYIACSSGLSASGALAKRLFEEKYSKKYPNSRIVVVDSLTSCMAQGIMVLDAAEMRDNGKTIDEIAKYIEENRLCYNQAATVEDLTVLAKHGRVKATAAFFGNVFGVKPLLISLACIVGVGAIGATGYFAYKTLTTQSGESGGDTPESSYTVTFKNETKIVKELKDVRPVILLRIQNYQLNP